MDGPPARFGLTTTMMGGWIFSSASLWSSTRTAVAASRKTASVITAFHALSNRPRVGSSTTMGTELLLMSAKNQESLNRWAKHGEWLQPTLIMMVEWICLSPMTLFL